MVMKRFFAIGLPVVISLLWFAGCNDSKSDEIAVRVAALSYAFEHDTETAANQTAWIFTIDSDLLKEEVAHSLSNYPLAKSPMKIEDRDMMRLIDLNSGKRLAHWTVKIRRKATGEAWAEVGCVKGGLNGYGQILVLKNKSGRWSVLSSIPSWVS
jgi:hypothetical protein